MPARDGYDVHFLTVPVPLPVPAAAGAVDLLVRLDYTHFTVLLRPDRRLAAATAVNIDGAALRDVDRAGSDWRLDDRVPVAQQTGEDVYARNDFDRGHLVRRRDPVWGEPQRAAEANDDTFYYTNAAPQVAVFNQSKDLWLGLEDYVLGHAESTDSLLSVLTGPVLADDDPVYRGLPVPRRFWKVAAWATGGRLAATGYLLDQSALVDELLARERSGGGAAAAADLGAYRTFQVPLTQISTATGLDLGPLVAADRLGGATTATAQAVAPIELTSWDDVVL